MSLSHRFTRLATRALVPFSMAAMLGVSACSDSTTAPTIDGVSAKPPHKPKADTVVTVPVTDTTTAPAPAPTTVNANTVLLGARLYVDPNSNAKKTADAWRSTRPADALQMDKIAAQSAARWIGNWNTNVQSDVNNFTTTITAAGALPVFVAYNIPQRDCGGLAANSIAPDQYKLWIDGFAQGIGTRRAVVVLEPDALAGMGCLSAADQQTRLALLLYAVRAFKALGATAVYIDAGHAKWMSVSTMATRLQQAGVAEATGFSLNVSNFVLSSDNVTYGQSLSALVGGKHFVIDTSRNGLGPTTDLQWCNPSGRALGVRPTTNTGVAGLDAYLWIKVPGESDGTCNGGPTGGSWWADYALGLAQRAAY